MLSEIWTIKGKNPCAIYVYDGSVKCIIEENKIKNPVDFIKFMFDKKEYKVIELQNDDILKNLPHPYYGLNYNKNFIYSLVQKSGLYYEQYIHDPNNPKLTTPSQFFGDVAHFIHIGKRVGWFQDRWSVNAPYDLNRVILVHRDGIKIKAIHPLIKKYMINNPLFKRLIETIGYTPTMINLQAYNPQQAIEKLKDKKIDVLVIANIIVVRKKEDLE